MKERHKKVITFGLAGLIALVVIVLMPLSQSNELKNIATKDVIIPDPDDKPLKARIWVPTTKSTIRLSMPLVVISHGTGGSLMGHADTAIELARAGFVVAAVNHTGDNYRDQSYVGRGAGEHLTGRPRHISRLIDYLLKIELEHINIDANNIGIFGFSAGGFTALVIAGGEPDLSKGVSHCQENPDSWDCLYLARHGIDVAEQSVQGITKTQWINDERIKAAVVAAPAVGYAFKPHGLTKVKIPVQLWIAENDKIVEASPELVKDLLPGNVDVRRVEGAGHFSFLSPCDLSTKAIISVLSLFGTPKICKDPAEFDRIVFHAEFNTEVVRFFRMTLMND